MEPGHQKIPDPFLSITRIPGLLPGLGLQLCDTPHAASWASPPEAPQPCLTTPQDTTRCPLSREPRYEAAGGVATRLAPLPPGQGLPPPLPLPLGHRGHGLPVRCILVAQLPLAPCSKWGPPAPLHPLSLLHQSAATIGPCPALWPLCQGPPLTPTPGPLLPLPALTSPDWPHTSAAQGGPHGTGAGGRASLSQPDREPESPSGWPRGAGRREGPRTHTHTPRSQTRRQKITLL